MRRLAGLFLVVASTALAAPQPKEKLPVWALAAADAAARRNVVARSPRSTPWRFSTTRLSLSEGTKAGRRGTSKRQCRQEKLVGGATFAVARDADRLFIGSARKLHAIEPIHSATLEPARSWSAAADAVGVLAVAPGGRRIVYIDGDQKLTVLDGTTGKSTGTVELAGRPVSASLTANGRIIAVVTRDGAARVYGLTAAGRLESLWSKRITRSDRCPPRSRRTAASSPCRPAVRR